MTRMTEEERKARAKEYRRRYNEKAAQNPELVQRKKASSREWYARAKLDPDYVRKTRATTRAWKAANPEKVEASRQRCIDRRAAECEADREDGKNYVEAARAGLMSKTDDLYKQVKAMVRKAIHDPAARQDAEGEIFLGLLDGRIPLPKLKRHVQFVRDRHFEHAMRFRSLDDTVPGSSELTYMDTLTYEHLEAAE